MSVKDDARGDSVIFPTLIILLQQFFILVPLLGFFSFLPSLFYPVEEESIFITILTFCYCLFGLWRFTFLLGVCSAFSAAKMC